MRADAEVRAPSSGFAEGAPEETGLRGARKPWISAPLRAGFPRDRKKADTLLAEKLPEGAHQTQSEILNPPKLLHGRRQYEGFHWLTSTAGDTPRERRWGKIWSG